MLVRPGLSLAVKAVPRGGCLLVSSAAVVQSTRRTIVRSAPLTAVQSHAFSTTTSRQTDATKSAQETTGTASTLSQEEGVLATYKAPLANTFVRLKVFSLSSLGAAVLLTPALLLAPADIGIAGRLGLVITALATSGASTAIFAWIGKPYVATMRLLDPQKTQSIRQKDVEDTLAGQASDAAEGMRNHLAIDEEEPKPAMQMMTTNWRLQKLRTTVFEPSLIRPASRPMAVWELANLPQALDGEIPVGKGARGSIVKLVASTRMEKDDKLVGRMWATWHADGRGEGCRIEGDVIRHFSIHEDLLGDDWRVL